MSDKATGWMTKDWARVISLLQDVKTCTGANPGVCVIGTAGGLLSAVSEIHQNVWGDTAAQYTTQLHPHCFIIQMECVSFPSPLERVLPPALPRQQKHGTSGASFCLHRPVFTWTRNSGDVTKCVTGSRLPLSCHDTGRT